ncbi:MAG: methyltransferase domain-containing protein [Oscillospiraceae bacterium]|nr:methyltransferase domain-containing protein [Oscillospiraceae bacterium]
MSLFICPLCGGKLEKSDKSYICPSGHSFDISSEGYVHLLPANKKHSKLPGDDKNMVRARNRFLSAGFYEPLLSALIGLLLELSAEQPIVLDSGCGEGYYSEGITKALMGAGKIPFAVGIDISKEAVRLAAKRVKNAEFAVASAYHLPLADGSVDFLINCFSPLCVSEFQRVLKTDGYFIYVVPSPRHLWELKCTVYDSPYENERLYAEYEGFEQVKSIEIKERIVLSDKHTLADLFTMTPYFWKTPQEGFKRLLSLDMLETEISFDIYLYKKTTCTGA